MYIHHHRGIIPPPIPCPVSRVPTPPMGWGGYDAPVVVYIHTYISTYLSTYVHTYIPLHYLTLYYLTLHYLTLHSIHTYIPLHYLTLHYLTLHYLTLHSIHTYIHYITYITYITYIPTYQHTTIPPPQATGGGTRRTIPTPQATGGGTRRTIPPPQATGGGDQKNQTILSTHTHWWGGRGGGQRCTIYIDIPVCILQRNCVH